MRLGRTHARIGTTAFAILGLLAVEAGTAYELAKRMERNYRFFWPRAESKLYEEVKKLVAAGLAASTRGWTGRRPKTIYRITAKGRRALSTWVEQPGAGPVLSFEGLLKVTYADFGSKRGLLAQLRAIEREASRTIALGDALGKAYAIGDVQHVERTHTNALVWMFLWEHFHAIRECARRAAREVSRWPSTRTSAENIRDARSLLRRSLAGGRAASRRSDR